MRLHLCDMQFEPAQLILPVSLELTWMRGYATMRMVPREARARDQYPRFREVKRCILEGNLPESEYVSVRGGGQFITADELASSPFCLVE